jgi:kynurenine formamidase
MKKIDLTVEIDDALWTRVFEKRTMSAFGHLGTHLDIMDKEFPLEYTVRRGRIFDVRTLRERDIEIVDVDCTRVLPGDFVIVQTGSVAGAAYGSDEYSANHTQLSNSLIKSLVERKVSLIGIDAAGIRRGAEHKPADQYCADNGVFVIENLANLEKLRGSAGEREFTVYTFPLHLKGASGLPCRVIAEC